MEEVVKGEDIIRLMLQFCKENDLLRTYNSMKEETEMKDNFVKDNTAFQKAFREGNWDMVLLELNDMTLSRGSTDGYLRAHHLRALSERRVRPLQVLDQRCVGAEK
jgi:hypothetical protein